MIPVKRWDNWYGNIITICLFSVALWDTCCLNTEMRSDVLRWLFFNCFFSFLQLIRWTPQVAVCWPICVRVRGKGQISCFSSRRFSNFKSCIHQRTVYGLLFYSSFLYCPRRRKPALQAWRPLEAKKSRRRRFSSASWAPRAWASASPVVQPRNLVSTSVTSNQAPSLQKLDLRWVLKMTKTHLWNSKTHIPASPAVNCIYVLSQNVDGRPDCGGERGGFHQCGPQRGEFYLI